MAAAAPVALAMAAGSQILGGIEANKAARAGAKVDEANALAALLEGEQEALQTRRDERQVAGEMIVAMGGSGVQLGSGSAADVLAESAYQRESEILNIRTRAVGEARNFNQAARDKRKAGKAALRRGVFGAAATAISGAADIRSARTLGRQAGLERAARNVPRMSVTGGGW